MHILKAASLPHIKGFVVVVAFMWKLHLTVSCREQNKLEKPISSSTECSPNY